MELSLESVGASELAHFAGLSAEGEEYYYSVPQQAGAVEPFFRGTIPEFVVANSDLVEQMRNVAKKCPVCGKSCASILSFCNGCNSDLSDAVPEYTENVCMAFVYGIERSSKFPMTLSLRMEEPDVLVYDDLLARGSCHLNAIPSDCHLPDWRHLLRNPGKGKALMQRLDEACWKVVHEQFWNNDAWRKSNFRDNAFASAEDFRSQIYAGVNSVPSQFQIHLQYIVPAITPADYHAFLHGKRLVKDRWLPLEYVMASLEAIESSADRFSQAHTMSMEDIFAGIAEVGGPVYDEMYAQAIRRYNRTHRACANWKADHFERFVLIRHPTLRAELHGAAADSDSSQGAAIPIETRPLRSGVGTSSVSQADLEKKDKLCIQSYGRPYDTKGRPSPSSYYKHARRPGEVLSADDWAKTLATAANIP